MRAMATSAHGSGQPTDPRLLIDSTPGLIHTSLPDGYLDFFNQSWLKYLGLTLEDVQGWKWTAVIHPDDVEGIVCRWRASLASGEPFLYEARVRRGDGEYRWMLHHKVALRDGLGKIVKRYGSSIDIEDRKRAEEKLRRSEFYLAEGQRLVHTGSWALNPSGFFEHWSQELFKIYGLDPQDGPPTVDQYLAAVHPQDREFMAETIKKMYAQRCGCDVKKRIVRLDGEVRYIRCVGIPVIDNKVLKGFLGTAMDVTEQEQLTQELQRREAYLAEAQRLSQTGSFGWKPASGDIVWSKETYRIFEIDGATKPSLGVVISGAHPEDRGKIQRLIDRAIREAGDWDLEHRLLMPDGSVKHLHVVGHAMCDEVTGEVEYVGAVMDVTRNKQAEEQIRQGEKELRQLIDSLPQHIFVCDTGGRLLQANQVALEYAGRNLKEMQEVGTEERIHPDDFDKAQAERQKGLSGATAFEIESRVLDRNGRYRWFLYRYKPVLDATDRIARWFVTGTDIEARKQEEEGIRKENIALRDEVVKTSMFEEIVGTSRALKTVLARVTQVACTDSTVLITGETGTGKELIARAIHRLSQRASRAFVSVNCAAVPRDLIASELFGHEKGAFTGALQRRLGRFELAEGGTYSSMKSESFHPRFKSLYCASYRSASLSASVERDPCRLMCV
jgi:PAS domain S-box-containing protein